MSFKVKLSEFNLLNLQDLGGSIGQFITNLTNVTINSIQIVTGASQGYVLTSNSSGVASWQPPQVQLNTLIPQ
jgi:hypothetical protein